MAIPIIRMRSALLIEEDRERTIRRIRESMRDGILILDVTCELLGVINDDGTFTPYLPEEKK